MRADRLAVLQKSTPNRFASADTSAAPSLRERKYRRIRQAIIDEAIRLFEANGYSNTTLRQIAEAAEISVATIMRYFASKDAILLDRERTLVAGFLERVCANGYATLSEGVRDIAWRSGVDLTERERLYQIILADPEFLHLTASLRREWESLLEQLYLRFSPNTPEGRLRAKSLAMMQTAIGLAGSQFWHGEGAGSPYPMQRELIDEFVAAFVKPIDERYAAQRKHKRTGQPFADALVSPSIAGKRTKRNAAKGESEKT